MDSGKKKWSCVKCGGEEYTTSEVVMKKKQLLAFSSPAFTLMICKRCKFVESYESGSTFWLMDQ